MIKKNNNNPQFSNIYLHFYIHYTGQGKYSMNVLKWWITFLEQFPYLQDVLALKQCDDQSQVPGQTRQSTDWLLHLVFFPSTLSGWLVVVVVVLGCIQHLVWYGLVSPIVIIANCLIISKTFFTALIDHRRTFSFI